MKTHAIALLLVGVAVAGCANEPTASASAEPSAETSPPATQGGSGPLPGGSPLTTTVSGQDFELSLTADRETYREEEPIAVEATLTYVGSQPEATVYGSGMGPIGFSVERVEDGLNPGGSGPVFTTDCRPAVFVRGDPVAYPFQKSGGFSADDPNAAIIEAYLNDPLLRLPPGAWHIRAAAGGFLGPNDCVGPQLSLEAEIDVTVEPGV